MDPHLVLQVATVVPRKVVGEAGSLSALADELPVLGGVEGDFLGLETRLPFLYGFPSLALGIAHAAEAAEVLSSSCLPLALEAEEELFLRVPGDMVKTLKKTSFSKLTNLGKVLWDENEGS